MSKIIILMLSGIGAGFVNGLLGTGGGIILIFALNKIMKNENSKDIYALTLTVTLALSLVSAFIYFKKGSIDLSGSVKYGMSAVLGGFAGAYMLDRLDGKIVKKIFGVLVIVAGLNMVDIF